MVKTFNVEEFYDFWTRAKPTQCKDLDAGIRAYNTEPLFDFYQLFTLVNTIYTVHLRVCERRVEFQKQFNEGATHAVWHLDFKTNKQTTKLKKRKSCRKRHLNECMKILIYSTNAFYANKRPTMMCLKTKTNKKQPTNKQTIKQCDKNNSKTETTKNKKNHTIPHIFS